VNAGEGLRRATRALWQEGVTSYCPTVVTNSDDAIAASLRAIAHACSQDHAVARAAVAIHLEGPFLSPEEGPRGAHSAAYIKAPDWPLFQQWQGAAQGRIRLITLAPEWPGAADFIARCVESGVLVAIGHTAATPEQIRAAVAAGARMSTHLGNGSHLMLPRHPNYLWEQLAHDGLWASLIADGFHLPAAVLTVMLRAKGRKALLVSDAVSLSGLPPGRYPHHSGGGVVLSPEGKLHLADNPLILAGSAQTLQWDIEHLVRQRITSLAEAWELASLRPSACLGLPTQGGVTVGAPADLVVFKWRGDRIHVLRTYKDGEVVYRSTEHVV
jgi:N-acetylglucosamine-6-phosphate deacetylase